MGLLVRLNVMPRRPSNDQGSRNPLAFRIQTFPHDALKQALKKLNHLSGLGQYPF